MRGKRRGIISGSIRRLPNAIVRRRVDWTQHELRLECCVFGAARSAASGDLATPNENVELAKGCVLRGVGKPGHTDGALRRLQEAARWGAMLFDRAFQLFDALEHTFGCQRIQERCH